MGPAKRSSRSIGSKSPGILMRSGMNGVGTSGFQSTVAISNPELGFAEFSLSSPKRELPSFPTLPRQARFVHAELHQPPLCHLGHVHRAAVGAAEAEVTGRFAEHVDLLLHFALGRQLHHSSLTVT